MRAARAPDKKSLNPHPPPEPQAQIQNNFTELFLMMLYAKVAQMIPLRGDTRALDKKYILNDIS